MSHERPWPPHPHPDTVQEVLDAIGHLHDHVLAAVGQGFAQLKQEIRAMSATIQGSIDTLTAQVATLTTVEQSAVALIQGFAARLQAAIDAATAAGASSAQLAQLDTLAAEIGTNTQQLADAVAASTPAAVP